MKFPEKLWTLVNKCDSGAIGWGKDGTSIFVDYVKFENQVLNEKSCIFKTKNIVSFIRQLNLYGFRKCSRFSDLHEFKNPNFVRGRRDLLKFMRRQLGFSTDVPEFGRALEKEKAEVSENQMSIPPNTGHLKIESLPSSSSSFNQPFSPSQEQDWPSSNWWENACYSMNLPNTEMNLPTKEKDASSNVNQDQNDTNQKPDENASWGNIDLRRNIVFVPVPVHFGMYSGFFNGNFPMMPFALPRQDEINKNVSAE